MEFFIPLQLVVFLVGSLLHFTHPTKGEHNKFSLLDVVSAVNESVWEHMKIFIVGSFIATLGYIVPFSNSLGDALLGSAISVSIAVLSIPIIFYGYNCIFANHILLLDIAIFYIACLIFEKLYEHFTPIQLHMPTMMISFWGVLLWSFIAIIVVYWTYDPPKIEMFRCPQKNCYGHPREW